jgi:type IV secretory pathway VirB2 component (pilin)
MDEPSNSSRGAIAALIAVVLLIVAGLWLMQHIRADARIQDCVMSGRTNCAPIAAPPR